MKQLYHIPLRYIILLILIFASMAIAVAQDFDHTPQQVYYSTFEADGVTPQHEYWYVIRFCSNKNFALRCDNDNTVLKASGYSSGSATSAASDEFKWKLVSSDNEGWYYLVSKTGMYVKYANNRFRPDADKANAAKVHLVYNTNNTHRYAWQIQREGSNNSMNPNAGLIDGHEITEWGTNDANNALLFDIVEEPDEGIDIFLQFSAYGRWAMYDDGVGSSPILRKPAGGVTYPTVPGYMWTKTRKGEGYILRSGNGRYIALSTDGNSLVMTDVEADAATIETSLNPFACDVNGTDGHTVSRYMYTIGDKVISVDIASNGIVLVDIPVEPSRSTIIRETLEIDGTEPPAVGSEEAPVWYNIRFTSPGSYLSVGNDDNKFACVGQNTNTFNPSMAWCLVTADIDRFYLKNYNGEYLTWSEADVSFSVTGDKMSAALFRLAEYAETGADRDKWVLHYVGATTANQYLRPNDAKDRINLTSAVDLRRSPVIFENKTLAQQIEHTLQPIYYSTNETVTPQHEYWYVIRFCRDNNYVLTCDDTVLKAGVYSNSSAAADAPDNMKWKLVASGTGEYYMVSKTGMYVKYANNRFRPEADKANATKVHLTYNRNNPYPYAWQIQRNGSNNSMNPYGGLSNGVEISEYNTGDRSNALLFELVEEPDATFGTFLQFSSYGRWALYDNGAGSAPIPQKPAEGVLYPTAPGYMWTKKVKVGGGYTLRSGNGNYIALGADGNSLVLTENEAEAAVINTTLHPYVDEVNGIGGRLVYRYMYTIGDKAIAINPSDNSIVLASAPLATRATIIRETTKIDGGEPPVISEEASPVWYNITFTHTGDNLAIGTDGGNFAFVGQSTNPLEQSMTWCLEKTGLDLFFLKNYNGKYLRWNDTDACFSATTDKTSAAPFRLVEYTETGADRDKWVLHYVGTKNQEPKKQYMLPGEDKTNVSLSSSDDLGSLPVVFKDRGVTDADFCTEEDNYWRQLYFLDTEMNLDQAIRGDGDAISVDTPDMTYRYLWKNIGDKDGFVLKNTAGQYLALNDTKDGFVYTIDRGKAVEFSLTESGQGGNLCTTWLFVCEDNGTRKVIRKDAEGHIVLLNGDEMGGAQEDISIYLGDKQIFGIFTPVAGQYYTIGIGTNYLNDGLGDVYDAVSANIGSVLGGVRSVTNDFLWTFIGKDGVYVLKNRNDNYLVWNTQGDNTFSISTVAGLATRFHIGFSSVELDNNGESAKPHLIPVEGENIGDGDKGHAFAFDSNHNAILSSTLTALGVEPFVIHEAEDYTKYKIFHKRSWFIKLSEHQKETSNSFIHHTEDGSYGLKTFTLADGTTVRRQNTNDYRIVRYMKRNTMRELRLPTSLYSGSPTPTRLNVYQRWYDYNTDGLIPDSLVFLNQQSRRNYSNGTIMGSVMHFNGMDYGESIGYGFNFKMPDNVPADFEYSVGIDMSFYTDFVEYYGDHGTPPYDPSNLSNEIYIPETDFVEPTLAGRCIYVVRNAHIMAKQLTALTENQGKWLEEYNVSFPARKVNFKDCALPLDNEFANYWIYRDGVEAEENLISLSRYENLEFRVANNKAGISVASYPVDQAENRANADLSLLRFFRFKYPIDAEGKECVPDGSTVDIEVYAKDGDKRYRLAVYHLTFVEGTELRSYTEIIGLKEDGTPKSQRSPRQLRRDIGEPKAHITFDFAEYESYQAPLKGRNWATKSGRDAGKIMPNTYRYPIRYENTSYVFEPTYISDADIVEYDKGVEENAFGSYTIAKTTRFGWAPRARFYPVRKYYQDAYPDEDYNYDNSGFLYIDASECPGRIVSLDFDGNICKGTRITVSAWISSPNCPNRVADAAYANVFFNILGYYQDKDGVEHEEKIYTYCPGPVSGDALLSDGTVKESTETDGGVWQQVYFTFIPRTEHIIERFVLNVNNACTNSAGGDILIDDIEVYAATPTVKVTNTLPVCNSSLTLTKMEIDYETMLNSMGLEEEELAKFRPSINYCVVDSAMYHSKLKELLAAGDPMPANNAMRYAAVGDIRRVSINTTFDKLPVYEHAKAVEASRPTVWGLMDENNMKQIVVSDKITSERMRPNKTYYLAAYFTYSNETIDFSAFQVGTECSISTLFTTRSSFNFIIDGEEDLASGGDATVCAGSNVTVSAKFCGVNVATGEEVLRILPCDWWLGYYGKDYAKAYINADGSYVLDAERPEGAVTVSEALTNFRYFYPDAFSTDACYPASASGYTLTQAMIDGLTALSRPLPGENARPALLLLYHRNINLQIPNDLTENDEYIVTLQPIDNMTDIDEEFKNSIICFEADTLSIRVNGHAPGLLNGFGNVKYPDYMSNVPLRLTLQELDNIRTSGLRVPLRSISPVSEEATGLESIELVKSDGTTYSPVYIAETSDPACTIFTDDGGLVEVGRITGMSADRSATEGYADITFLESFTPHEGYTYTLRANYREAVPAGVERNTCNGSFVFDLKVVPRYAVWTAAAGNAEWTNDLNWKRADRTDLKLDEATEADYPTNEENTTASAFAPLAGTSVIVASDAPYQPVLYGDKVNDTDGLLQFTGHETGVTQDIAYDLIVGTSAAFAEPYVCSSFRTNRCDGLVLQAGAELLQAQHLEYGKAWAEYELAPGRWYTLGTPLQQIYAGDWYAPKTDGRESAPYFCDINFNTDNNDRFSPAVYQRGWDKGTAMLYYLDDPTVAAPASGNIKNTNVAVLADWSSVYNDVSVCYDNAGFSLKAEHAGNGKLLFRLPKEDKAYDYYLDGKPENGSNHTTVVRGEKVQHKLWTDKLKDATEFTCSLRNERTENLYYLVNNPFPCGLDMDKFFEKNKEILEQKYWLFTANGQSAAIKDPSSPNWVSVNAGGATDRPVLASGQGFFVKLREGKTSCELTYSADMMAEHGERTSLLRTPATRAAAPRTEIPGLHIRAERDGQASEAVIVEDDNATDGYSSVEDMETLLDESLAATPTVYTLAGNRATTVNRRRSIYSVGLGVTGRSSDEVKLTFSGMNGLREELSLLDALTGELTLLSTGTDNVSVTVPGRTANRFFLVSSVDDKYMGEDADGTVSITTHRGEVAVTATGSLQLEEVYAIAPDGRVFHSATPSASVYKFRLVPGIYLISTRTVLGTVTRKVVVE